MVDLGIEESENQDMQRELGHCRPSQHLQDKNWSCETVLEVATQSKGIYFELGMN